MYTVDLKKCPLHSVEQSLHSQFPNIQTYLYAVRILHWPVIWLYLKHLSIFFLQLHVVLHFPMISKHFKEVKWSTLCKIGEKKLDAAYDRKMFLKCSETDLDFLGIHNQIYQFLFHWDMKMKSTNIYCTCIYDIHTTSLSIAL